jgi:hypothetical protein
MPVNQNEKAYAGRVIGTEKVAGLVQYASNKVVLEGYRIDRALNPQNAARAMQAARMFDDCNVQPISAAVGGGAATGTAGDENVLYSGANSYMYHILGTQTITAPKLGAAGLDINMDQTDNDGIEMVPGDITSVSRYAFTVGTDATFEFRVKFSIADVSGTDDCAIGFRKAEAFQAAIDNYDEMAAMNVISGNINIETILNGAATSTTDTTDNWADAATHELKVRVYKTGACQFFIDGAAPTVTAQFTFDSGEVVIPFIYFLNASDVAGAVQLQELEVGRWINN